MPLNDRCQICHQPFTPDDRGETRLGPKIVVRKDLGHVHAHCSIFVLPTVTCTIIIPPKDYFLYDH